MPPMIGRKDELDALIRALERAQGGRGSVALIGGEAGIGKTTLAGELRSAAESRGVPVLWGRTPEAAWAGPTRPGSRRWTDSTAAAHRSSRPPTNSPRMIARRRFTTACFANFWRLLRRNPALLVLEDLHWAQPVTLDLLRHIAFGAARSGLLIVGTYRASAAAPHLPLGKTLGHLRREAEVLDLSLAGLDRAQLQRLLGSPSQKQIDRVLAETNGNPLFALAVGQMLDTAADTAGSGSPDDSGVPLALRQAIGQRVDTLSEPTQRVLSTGAIFEDAFDVTTLSALLSLPEESAIEALDEATLEGFVQPGSGLDEFVFAHAIVRQAVLANWQPSRLVRERRRIAEQLASAARGNRPGEIASLYHLSRPIAGSSAGVPFALEAADEARAAGSHEQTATFLQMAIDLLEPDDPRRDEILRELAIAQAESLQIDPAIAIRLAGHRSHGSRWRRTPTTSPGSPRLSRLRSSTAPGPPWSNGPHSSPWDCSACRPSGASVGHVSRSCSTRSCRSRAAEFAPAVGPVSTRKPSPSPAPGEPKKIKPVPTNRSIAAPAPKPTRS